MDNFDLKKYLKEGFLDHPSERESKRDFKNQFPKSKGFAGEPGVTSASRSQDFGHPDNIISVVDDMTLTMGEDAFIAAIFKALSLEDAKRVLRVITNDNPIENELGPVTYDWLNEGYSLEGKDLDLLKSLKNQIDQGVLDSKKKDEFVALLTGLIDTNVTPTDLEEGMSVEGIVKSIEDIRDSLESGESDGIPLDNETEALLHQELERLKGMLRKGNGEFKFPMNVS